MGKHSLSGEHRHVCTECGKDSCRILYIPAKEPRTDHPVYHGERLCKKCFNNRVKLNKIQINLDFESEPASASKACCGGCKAQMSA